MCIRQESMKLLSKMHQAMKGCPPHIPNTPQRPSQVLLESPRFPRRPRRPSTSCSTRHPRMVAALQRRRRRLGSEILATRHVL